MISRKGNKTMSIFQHLPSMIGPDCIADSGRRKSDQSNSECPSLKPWIVHKIKGGQSGQRPSEAVARDDDAGWSMLCSKKFLNSGLDCFANTCGPSSVPNMRLHAISTTVKPSTLLITRLKLILKVVMAPTRRWK
mmetsp:Transcript_100/g.312  ORF Transcript_100/g.312 Transcript_100/m.312 type:complete len:135 (+) Transcript_100:545-949(+)